MKYLNILDVHVYYIGTDVKEKNNRKPNPPLIYSVQYIHQTSTSFNRVKN